MTSRIIGGDGPIEIGCLHEQGTSEKIAIQKNMSAESQNRTQRVATQGSREYGTNG